jgi:hypothetical protein
MASPLEIFFSYAHEDEDLMNDVRRQFEVHERNGRILNWHDRKIPAGSEWRNQIDRRLERADIVLLFVSPHFIESRYCYEVEGRIALRRHRAGKARVVPVILRPCSWEDTPFGQLQGLPRNGRPVSRWEDRDEACLDVAKGVMAIVDELAAVASGSQPPSSDPRDAFGGGAPRESATVSDTESLADLESVQCSSGACGSPDVELSDGVQIAALKADPAGWTVQGIVDMDYSIRGECQTCGRVFQVVKRQIPVQFPELACNECNRSAFLQYQIQELKRVAEGFEFTVAIRCSGCQGRKNVSKLLTGLLRAVGVTVGLDGIDIRKSAGSDDHQSG